MLISPQSFYYFARTAAGYTLKLPLEDKYMHPKSGIDDLAVISLVTRPRRNFGEVTTGAQSDLRRATV